MTSKISKYTFTVRAHDLDSSGSTSPSGLCRILECTRWYSITTGGIMGKYVQLGVVRAQHLEILKQVTFGHKIEVATWVSRIGGTSFDFSSTIKSREDESIIARSSVTFVAMDGMRKPSQVNKGLHELLVDEDAVAVPRIHRDLDKDAWSETFKIRKSDLDLLGHMNQARYIDYIEDARFSCGRHKGYRINRENADKKIHRFTISYEDQGRVGDLLRIYTWAVHDSSNQLAFEIRREADHRTITRAEMSVT